MRRSPHLAPLGLLFLLVVAAFARLLFFAPEGHPWAQVQSVLLLFAAGAGAYALAFTLFGSRAAAGVSAVGFGLTSQLFGHLEHTSVLSAGTLMPWCFFAAARLVRDWWAGPLLASLTALLVTTGYPAAALITLLWVGVFVLFERAGLPYAASRALLLRRAFAAAGLAIALSAVHWLPIVALRGEFTRGASLPLDRTLFDGNLSFRQVWSTLFQFMMVNALPGHESDVSVRGFYFGALCLPLGVVAALGPRDRLVRGLLVFSATAFLLACGGEFFGRTALHAALPLFRFSRFPGEDGGLLAVLGLTLLWTGAAVLLGLAALRAVYPVHQWGDVALPWGSAELLFLGGPLLAVRAAEGRALAGALLAVLALEQGTSVTANFHVAGQPWPRWRPAPRCSARRSWRRAGGRCASRSPPTTSTASTTGWHWRSAAWSSSTRSPSRLAGAGGRRRLDGDGARRPRVARPGARGRRARGRDPLPPHPLLRRPAVSAVALAGLAAWLRRARRAAPA